MSLETAMSPQIAIRSAAHVACFDAQPAVHRIGLIALATDLTSEGDFARICTPRNVAVHVARVLYENPTNAQNLRAMQPRLAEAAKLILPGETLDAIAYSCTAASVLIGDAEVAAAVQSGRPGVPCVTPIGAALAALRRLGARRISILTPYTEAVTRPVCAFFAERGFELRTAACFGLEDDRRMARLTPQSLVEAAGEICDSAADALFVSCTALRACEAAEAIEARIGRPVVTANQAMIWGALRAAGYGEPIPGFGRLFRLPAQEAA
jgi:maleate isomerase